MAAIITEKFRTHNARQFIEDFGEANSSNYIFIGRSHSWADDTSPPAPANSESEEIQTYEDMIALKKVATSDITHGLVRYDWDSTGNTAYDEWRDNYSSANPTNVTGVSNFFDGRGYVITDEYKVYKCLRTGTSSGSPVNSTIKPTSVDTVNPEATGDGYLWKFMYTVSASDVIKFVTNDFIPVKTLGAQQKVAGSGVNGGFGSTADDDGSAQWDVEAAAVDGAIYHYIVEQAGSGYTLDSGSSVDVAVEGDGSGAVATINFSGGSISSVTFKDSSSYGSGYKRASFPTLDSTISGISGGSGGSIKPVISPINGHGANPIEEMGGNYVIVNSRLEFGEGAGDFPTDNDFRRIGLIKNPVQSSDSTISGETSLTATSQITVDNAASISVDDIIMDSNSESATTAKHRVVSKTNNVLKTLPVVNSGGEYVDFANSDEVYVDGAKVADVNSDGVSTAHPEMTRFSGQILYVENRGAVTRAADQIEDIKLIIEM